MRTNIDIDDDLLQEAMASTGETTKRATVDRALRLMVQLQAQQGIRELRGKVEFYPDYDYKAMRRSRHGIEWSTGARKKARS